MQERFCFAGSPIGMLAAAWGSGAWLGKELWGRQGIPAWDWPLVTAPQLSRLPLSCSLGAFCSVVASPFTATVNACDFGWSF